MKLKGRFSFCLLLVVFATSFSNAAPLGTIPYYGTEFQGSADQLKDEPLVQLLKKVLTYEHLRKAGQPDQIVGSCKGSDCYAHKSLGYDAARKIILGDFYLIPDGGDYLIQDVYCEKAYGPDDLKGSSPGPNKIPDNKVINVEHTWPQSKFTRKFPDEMQKSDLHHLFPSDSEMNSIRGNYPFGEVAQDQKVLKCPCSRFGTAENSGKRVFEPPVAHRGNVARALFYFAIRYDMKIDPDQEANLRKWHQEDPADQAEMDRNEEIYRLQGNRNPFIDDATLASRISDF